MSTYAEMMGYGAPTVASQMLRAPYGTQPTGTRMLTKDEFRSDVPGAAPPPAMPVALPPAMPPGMESGMSLADAGVTDAAAPQNAIVEMLVQALREGGIDPEKMTPEMVEAMADLGVIPDQQALITGQRAQAQALRNMPMPEGRKAGAIYTAAHPLEFLGKLGATGLGASRDRDLLEQQQAAIDAQRIARRNYGMGYAGHLDPTKQMDAKGKVVTDADGNPVMIPAREEFQPIPEINVSAPQSLLSRLLRLGD